MSTVAVEIVLPALSEARPCQCGHPTCKDWHVYPGADVQGVNFTERQARAVADMLNMLATDDAREATARNHYEAHRALVAGRPAWEDLNPGDSYDFGMMQHARSAARHLVANACEAKAREIRAEEEKLKGVTG